jgi:hypothetical protein
MNHTASKHGTGERLLLMIVIVLAALVIIVHVFHR